MKAMMSGFAIILISLVLLYRGYIKGKDSEIIQVLTSYAVAENRYFESYGKFSVDSEELGYVHSNSNWQVFFQSNNLPRSYLDVIPKDSLPFVSDDDFRILLVIRNEANKRFDFWIVDRTKKIRKLEETLSL